MPYIGCTQKLLNEIKPAQILEPTSQRGLQGWHANIYRFFHRKSVLLVNDETRFAVFMPGLVKKDFMNFDKVFIKHFEIALQDIGATSAQIAQAKLLLGPFSYGKTYSRSVLGTMNDMKFNMEYMLKNRLGYLPRARREIQWITGLLNETPYSVKSPNRFPAVLSCHLSLHLMPSLSEPDAFGPSLYKTIPIDQNEPVIQFRSCLAKRMRFTKNGLF